jgi:glycosyltransferase involved in cell wall biosynthesis
VEGLAEALMKALNDKGLAEKMGKAGRKMISEKFSADHMVRSIEKLYFNLLTMKGIQFEH